MSEIDAAEIKRLLTEDLERLLDVYFPGHVTARGCAYPAYVNAKDFGSFQVYLRGPKRGEWFRNSQGIGGDALNLLAYGLTGNHKADASTFREAKEFLGIESARPRDPKIEAQRRARHEEERKRRAAAEAGEAKRRAMRAETAQEIVARKIPVAGTLAETYLRDVRGLPVPPSGWPDDLGFVAELEYATDPSPAGSKSRHPALVAAVRDMSGDIIAVHCIYLDASGRKAKLDPCKVTIGPMAGGVVRLGPAQSMIGLAEGMETAFAAMALESYSLPVWAGLSTSGVRGFEIPYEISKIIAFPDGDAPVRRKDGEWVPELNPPGIAAFRELKKRCAECGVEVQIPETIPSGDYLNALEEAKRAGLI